MNDEWSMLIAALRQAYRFRDLNLVGENPMIISTDKGLKRIRFWDDERLLKKHLDWRDRLISEYFFIDRMYVTASGIPYIRFGRYAITCHDAPPDAAAFAAYQDIWAEIIYTLLQRSREMMTLHIPGTVQLAEEYYERAAAAGLFTGRIGKLAVDCYPSVLERATRSDRIRSGHLGRHRLFVLPGDFSFGESKRLFDTLFIILGQSGPIPGYDSVARFFLDIFTTFGEEAISSFFLLLKERGHPGREATDLITAAWYDPQEWFRLTALLFDQPDGRQTEQELIYFKKIWDSKTRLIYLFQSIFTAEEAGDRIAGGTEYTAEPDSFSI